MRVEDAERLTVDDVLALWGGLQGGAHAQGVRRTSAHRAQAGPGFATTAPSDRKRAWRGLRGRRGGKGRAPGKQRRGVGAVRSPAVEGDHAVAVFERACAPPGERAAFACLAACPLTTVVTSAGFGKTTSVDVLGHHASTYAARWLGTVHLDAEDAALERCCFSIWRPPCALPTSASAWRLTRPGLPAASRACVPCSTTSFSRSPNTGATSCACLRTSTRCAPARTSAKACVTW